MKKSLITNQSVLCYMWQLVFTDDVTGKSQGSFEYRQPTGKEGKQI